MFRSSNKNCVEREELLFIDYAKGRLVQVRDAVVVLETNGVGCSLVVPDSTKRALPSVGEDIRLFCWTPAREPTLLGFMTEEERRLFCYINSDPESSPSLTLAILGVLSEEQRGSCLATINCSPARHLGKAIFRQVMDDARAAISSFMGLILPQSYLQRRCAVASLRRLGLVSDAGALVQAASIRWRESCEMKNYAMGQFG